MTEKTYRIGLQMATSQVTRLGSLHGIAIKLDYAGGKAFYQYVTRQRSKLNVFLIGLATPPTAVWSWMKFKNYVKGVLDAAEGDWNNYGEVTKILIQLGTTTGFDQTWFGALEDLLWAIGPARKGLLGIAIGGSEWNSWGVTTPPKTYGEAMSLLQPIIDLIHSYGYKTGSAGIKGLLTKGGLSSSEAERVSLEMDWYIEDVWIPYRTGVTDQTSLVTTYNNFKKRLLSAPANTVACYAYIENTARGAEDGVPPWYLTSDVFDYLFTALDEVWVQRKEALKYGIIFPFSHYTYNDAEGWTGHSSILDWLFVNPNLAQTHNIRTSDFPEQRESYPPITVTNPFPPYPTAVFAGAPHPPPPHAVTPDITFGGAAYAIKLIDGSGLNGELVDFYVLSPSGTKYKVGSVAVSGSWALTDLLKMPVGVTEYGKWFFYTEYSGNPVKGLKPATAAATMEPLLYVEEANRLTFDVIDKATGQHLSVENGDYQEDAYTEVILWILINEVAGGKIEGMGDQGQTFKGGPVQAWLAYSSPNAYPDSVLPVTFTYKILFPSPVSIGGKIYRLQRVYDEHGTEYPIVPNLLAGHREYGHMPGIVYTADAERTIIGEYTLSTNVYTLSISSSPIPVTVEINAL